MKAAALGWGVAGRGPCAAAATLPRTLLRQAKAAARCSLSSSQSSVASTCTSSDHVSFIEDVAAARPPEHLDYLLNMLQTRGETIMSPGARQGLIPLVIPLSRSPSGALTALLRWPTSPPGMEMPIVEVHKHGVWLLAKNVFFVSTSSFSSATLLSAEDPHDCLQLSELKCSVYNSAFSHRSFCSDIFLLLCYTALCGPPLSLSATVGTEVLSLQQCSLASPSALVLCCQCYHQLKATVAAFLPSPPPLRSELFCDCPPLPSLCIRTTLVTIHQRGMMIRF